MGLSTEARADLFPKGEHSPGIPRPSSAGIGSLHPTVPPGPLCWRGPHCRFRTKVRCPLSCLRLAPPFEQSPPGGSMVGIDRLNVPPGGGGGGHWSLAWRCRKIFPLVLQWRWKCKRQVWVLARGGRGRRHSVTPPPQGWFLLSRRARGCTELNVVQGRPDPVLVPDGGGASVRGACCAGRAGLLVGIFSTPGHVAVLTEGNNNLLPFISQSVYFVLQTTHVLSERGAGLWTFGLLGPRC